VDGDCPAGSACESGSCEALPCRQANLDCNFNEFCDPVSGECVPTPGLHCAACDPGDNIWSNHGTEDPCDDTIVGHPVCGEEGSVCANSASFGDCWVACSEQSDCPGGYTCEPVPQATPGGCAEDVLWVGPVCRPNGSCEFE